MMSGASYESINADEWISIRPNVGVSGVGGCADEWETMNEQMNGHKWRDGCIKGVEEE